LPGGFASVQGPARRYELVGFGVGKMGSNPMRARIPRRIQSPGVDRERWYSS
jgi:hypothetical protein